MIVGATTSLFLKLAPFPIGPILCCGSNSIPFAS
jgi:hypothetical protein